MKHLKFILYLFIAIFAVATTDARTIDEITNVHLADSTKFTADPDNYLSAAAIARADSITRHMWNVTTAEPVAVVVKNCSGIDPDIYATELFEAWGIGKKDKDNGLLILISIEDRKAVIRTGYGIEGLLNDGRCGTIIRHIIIPCMKENNVDGAVVGTLTAVSEIITTPEAADELLSKYANNAGANSNESDPFKAYLIIGCIIAVAMPILLIVIFCKSRRQNRHERYHKLNLLKVPFLVLTIGFIGIPILGYLLLLLLMHRARHAKTLCPNCQAKMELIDEVHDNSYLTPAQDREEQLGSVDYDVWHCNNCGENVILPYINQNAPYSVCKECGARAGVLISNSVVRQPTTEFEGVGCKRYHCKNCGKDHDVLYQIAKIVTPPIVILPGGGHGFGGGGGGFGGGSFGGGMTGGGGASGGW